MSDEAPRLLLPSAGRKVALMRVLERYFKVYPCGFSPRDSASGCLVGRGRFVEQPRGLDLNRYVTWMVDTCRRIGIDLVVPVRDGDMSRLDFMRDDFEAMGVKLILSPKETIEVVNDKYLMYARLGDRILVPPTFKAESWKVMTDPFPLFAKERCGAGSVVARKVHTPEELGQLMVHHDDLVVQPWIGGQEYTVDMFFAEDGGLLQEVCRKRITVSGGQTDYGEVIRMPGRLVTEILKLAAALEFIGPINVQFIESHETPGEFWLTDVNCRFGGGTPLSIAAGADFAKYLYRLYRGAPIKATIPKLGTKGISFTDYAFDIPGVGIKRGVIEL